MLKHNYVVCLAGATLLLSSLSQAGQLDYQFNSPVFNGSGYGTYELTIKQLQDQARTNNESKAQALADAAASAAAIGKPTSATSLKKSIFYYYNIMMYYLDCLKLSISYNTNKIFVISD